MEILEKIGRLVKDPAVQIDLWGFIFALGVSALVGVAVSALYQIFYENRATGAQVHRSFLLMAPSITALFIAIQFSLPLSLGLLGALSVVRFRTPIKEPEEVGFIMLLIAGSVVCATFQFKLLFVLLFLLQVFFFSKGPCLSYSNPNERMEQYLLHWGIWSTQTIGIDFSLR